MNPNNCASCDNKARNNTEGWCYMWKDEPTKRCYQHTAYDEGRRVLLVGGRMHGKSYVLELLSKMAEARGQSSSVIAGQLGTYGGFSIIIDELFAKQHAEVKPVRIQHGPVRKGRGGKVRKW